MRRDEEVHTLEGRGKESVESPHLRVVPPPPPARRWWRGSGMRVLLGVLLVALVIHLIPLFLPRNMPEQELAIARALPEVQERVKVLRPLREHPKATAEELREAAELLMEGASGEALELVREAERREPDALETQLLLARVCELENRERCVREALDRAGRLAPRDPRPDLLRAELQLKVGNRVAAVESVGRAYRHAPGQLEVAVRYVRLLAEVGRYREAEEVLKGLAGSVEAPKLLMELGLVRLKQERDEDARALFAKAVEEEPGLAVGHYYLGLTLFRMGRTAQAEEELREADRLDVGDWRALGTLCAIQNGTGQKEAARISRMDLERRFPERMEEIRGACQLE